MFTNEPPTETMINSNLDMDQKEKNHYNGFTFERNDIMSKMSSGNFGATKK